jgi:hypothetical protein
MNLVHLSQKIPLRQTQQRASLERLLDRHDLNRNLKLKQKIELLLQPNDDSQESSLEDRVSGKRRERQRMNV